MKQKRRKRIGTKNKKRKPEEMTFAPRSCPSCPILQTKILGRRPSFFENS